MTQTYKRFWYDFEDPEGPKIIDMVNDKEYSLETIGDFNNIEKILNELADENELLKSFVKGKCLICGAYLGQQYKNKFGNDLE